MSDTGGWKEKADERLTAMISSELDEASVVTGWSLLVQYVDSNGDVAINFNSMPDQKVTHTLGQLVHGLLVEAALVFWNERPQ